jgi:hypothetical protein
MDAARASLPACVVCNKPSAYRNLDCNWSHQYCARGSSEEQLLAKIASRRGKVAANAGPSDLGGVMRDIEKHSSTRNAQSPTTVARGNGGSRSPEFIARMSERDIFDLDRIRVDVLDPAHGSRELVDRARSTNDLAFIRSLT